MADIGVAVVGAGYWGPNLARNFLASADAELRWVCDLDAARAARAAGRQSTVRTTTSFEAMLDDPDVHGVAIATPAATHVDLAIACLDAGKHVLVEKPLAPSVAEGERLVAHAERRGLLAMCDHTYCYTPVVQRIAAAIGGGELGDVQYIDSVRINLGLVQSDVDVFWDLAPHDLSILDSVLPPEWRPVAVAAQGVDPIGAGRTCIGYLTLFLGNGALAHIHVNWLSPSKVRTTVIGGSKQMLVWDDLQPSQRLSIYDKGVAFEPAEPDDSKRQTRISYRLGAMTAPALPEAEALAAVVKEFATAIRDQRRPLTDGNSGLRVLRILEAIPESLARNGAAVRIDSAVAAEPATVPVMATTADAP